MSLRQMKSNWESNTNTTFENVPPDVMARKAIFVSGLHLKLGLVNY